MTEGTHVSPQALADLSGLVSSSTVSGIASARQTARGTVVPDGAFSRLEFGPVADQMVNGLAERMQERLRELGDRFADVADRLDQSRVLYERTEATNVGLSEGVEI